MKISATIEATIDLTNMIRRVNNLYLLIEAYGREKNTQKSIIIQMEVVIMYCKLAIHSNPSISTGVK